jgi:hypothetical protein
MRLLLPASVLSVLSALAACAGTSAPPAPAAGDAPVVAAEAAAAGPHDRPGFRTFLDDGRVVVFRSDDAELDAFTRTRELGKSVTRLGEGPGGATLRAPDHATLDAYLLARPGFATRIVDGRIWVFAADSDDWRQFLRTGDPARAVTRVGAGPNGMTVKGSDAAVLDAWLAAL